MTELMAPPISLDECEALIQQLEPCEFPVVHRFTPGLYIRECHLPKGSILTSKIHKTEHPYTISCGKVSVKTEGGPAEHLEAPYTGITKPGTRRIIFAHEYTIWTTYHPTNKTTVDEIEEDIIEKHVNHLLEKEVKQLEEMV